MDVFVWGTGDIAKRYIDRRAYYINENIIACIDNDRTKWGKKFKGFDIMPPDELERTDFDKLIICAVTCNDIKRQIERDLRIDGYKVVTYFEQEEAVKSALIKKYKNSVDADLQKVLDYYKNNPLNIFGYYQYTDQIVYPVTYESDGMPYIWFENKKMYFPRDYDKFSLYNDKKCVMNLMREQGSHSPHQYIQDDDFTAEDKVLVDAGVCEGNFALRYVDVAKKIYLIESDHNWSEALDRTFEPYKDKVVICKKYLSDEDSDTTITLDTLVRENIDFLKMDIEGYEIPALTGGKYVLRESKGCCAICSYHKHNDEISIKNILHTFGYQTKTSEGYMFFPYDTVLEFRRGVVYGRK